MKWLSLVVAVSSLYLGHSLSPAGAAELHIRHATTNAFLSIQGNADYDYLIQTSTNLAVWTNLTSFGTLLADPTNPPTRSVTATNAGPQFYRAARTDGLFDRTLLRTISLNFRQGDWQSELVTARFTGQSIPCTLTSDNGAVRFGVGARYKGNTSFSGAGPKKSINLELNFTNAEARLMGHKTINLNNAFGDETILREPVYFNTMVRYSVSPAGALVQLSVNNSNWGVYSFVEQENNELIQRFFPSDNGDRWRAPNISVGGFGGSRSALSWLGTNINDYLFSYELKSDPNTNAWPRLIHAIDVLNNTPAAQLRDRVEDVFDVDRWLWFLAVENIFADDDSYWHKGADYGFYFEPESGRIHPIEHDGNEAFMRGDETLSPLEGMSGTNRPLLYRLLPIPELRQRYLAHMRTVLEESFQPARMIPVVEQFVALSAEAIAADPVKGYTMGTYSNELGGVRAFVTNRYNFLANHSEVRRTPPEILTVLGPLTNPAATEIPAITAQVRAGGTNGISSVWLYHRGKSYGRFVVAQMFDDGDHGDGAAADGVFGAFTTNYPAGTKVRYYIEARSAAAPQAARFAPVRAEGDTFSYRVAVTTATNSPIAINELMASNTSTLADPQGEFDDWIELRNLTDQDVDLSGRYLSDEPNNPRKWGFPSGTIVPANGFLLVWADEDGLAPVGLHASFKLDAEGESLFLTDTDANYNAILDSVTFGEQTPDRSYARQSDNADVWVIANPTPNAANP